jgi:hypothetical protein
MVHACIFRCFIFFQAIPLDRILLSPDNEIQRQPMLHGYGDTDTDTDTAIRGYGDFPKTQIRGYVVYIIKIKNSQQFNSASNNVA